LWDTEGPSDPKESQKNADAVFGLSVTFSSVVIWNIKEKFTTSNMDKMQVFALTFLMFSFHFEKCIFVCLLSSGVFAQHEKNIEQQQPKNVSGVIVLFLFLW